MFCALAEYVWTQEKSKTVLINPVSLSKKNYDDFFEFTDFSEKDVVIVKGTPKEREMIYKSGAKVFIIGSDMFGRENQKLPSDVRCCIIDESHLSYSSIESQRTQSLGRNRKRFDRMLFCTATPVGDRYSAIYPTVACINPLYYGNYKRFLQLHAVYDYWGHIVAWKNPQYISEFLKKYSCGISFEEAYPNKTETLFIKEPCELSPELEKYYEEMEQDALVELEDKYLEANGPMIQSLRCRQILACPETLGITLKQPLNKDELLKTHLNRGSLVVFSMFHGEQKRIKKICDDMGISCEIMNGETSSMKRGEIDQRFRNGTTKVLICSPQVAGVGFNWEHVDEICFMSMTYSASEFTQAIGRGNRGTRKKALPVYILSYDCKVEKRVLEIVKRKLKENKGVMNGL